MEAASKGYPESLLRNLILSYLSNFIHARGSFIVVDENKLEKLSTEAKNKIEDSVKEYERNLRQEYRRSDDQDKIIREKRSFKSELIARELADEERNAEDLRKEESDIISTNLLLSLLFVGVFTLFALISASEMEAYAKSFSNFFVRYFSWFYLLISTGSLIFLAYLAFSRFGSVVLGSPEEEAEFDDLSWYAMLFSAGMGAGLMFYGVAEPLRHLSNPPFGASNTVEAARWSMIYSAFHWGFHGWGIYTLCAVGVAYYGFRKRKKYLLSSSIIDISDGPLTRKLLKIATDLCSTLAVVFGVTASLGLGIQQISGGLKHVWKIDMSSTWASVGLVALVTVMYMISASTGLDKGIKWLSNINMAVAIALMIFVFICGPSLFQIKLFVDTIGQYLNELFSLSFKISPLTPAYEEWMGDWTLVFFTWWIAWGPFVGIFIARISRGRTIREVIMGALLVPTIFSILWFSVFGGAALHGELMGDKGSNLAALAAKDLTVTFFSLLEQYPLYHYTAGISILLLLTFLVTSADSACFTIAMMTTEGDLDPSSKMKLLWGSILSGLTLLLMLGGGLKAMQACVLAFAFPFSWVIILVSISVLIRLSISVKKRRI